MSVQSFETSENSVGFWTVTVHFELFIHNFKVNKMWLTDYTDGIKFEKIFRGLRPRPDPPKFDVIVVVYFSYPPRSLTTMAQSAKINVLHIVIKFQNNQY